MVDGAGDLLCGLADGRIVAIGRDRGHERTLADTQGRPLGLEVLPDGRILICDAERGLLRLNRTTGVVETLVDQVDGIALRFCSNAVAGADGTIWFTQSTNRFDFAHYLGALLEHRPSGRLLRRDPDGAVSVVLDGLHFPNGLTLVDDGTAIVFAETDGYRLSRLDLAGAEAGRLTIIADNLPGFPDNLSAFRDGRFWVAMVSRRNAMLDRAGRWPGWLRRLAWSRMSLAPPRRGTTWVMAFDGRGTLLADWQTARPDFFGATGVVEVDRRLYLAGVDTDGLLEIELPRTPPAPYSITKEKVT